MTTSQDDAPETRIHDLELEVGSLREKMAFQERHLSDMAEQFSALHAEVKWLRRRFASFQPEVHNCPKCKAAVGSTATSCRCGHRWGPTANPREGLPT